jgi:hypothetical protein
MANRFRQSGGVAALALGLLLGCAGEPPAVPSEAYTGISGTRHPVTTLFPPNPGTARAEPMLPDGTLSAIPCAQCHETRTAPETPPEARDIEEVHRGMQLDHGGLSCFACHEPTDSYRTLKLADGTPVAYERVMTLCSQCHGPQRADYDHGAHGGMTGYWDLSRGPRVKNACTVCHDPHSPRFPSMRPTFKPRDRFLTRADASEGHADGH